MQKISRYFRSKRVWCFWQSRPKKKGLTPEIERALTVYLEGAAENRDRVADFIHFCEGMAELAKAEGKRLQNRQKQG